MKPSVIFKKKITIAQRPVEMSNASLSTYVTFIRMTAYHITQLYGGVMNLVLGKRDLMSSEYEI